MNASAREGVLLNWLWHNNAPMSLTVKEAMRFVIQRRVMNAGLAEEVMDRLEGLHIPSSEQGLDLMIEAVIEKAKEPQPPSLPIHRTEANHGIICSTCDGGGCPDCTDPA